MANQTETLISEVDHGDDENKLKEEEEEEEELEKLVADVNLMAQKILDYRTILPDQLKNALASTLAAQRPLVPTHLNDGFEPGPSSNSNPDAGVPIESRKGTPLAEEEDKETAEKTLLLRHKISSYVSAMPVLLNRMKDCISRIDNLESCNGLVHPAFKRKRTS